MAVKAGARPPHKIALVPRVGLSWLLLQQRNERTVGFSDSVDLGGVGALQADPALAMRVTPGLLAESPPPRLNLYLRGTTFDAYDGRSWYRTQTGSTPLREVNGTHLISSVPTATDARLQIDLEPLDPPVLFVPPDAIALRLRQPLRDSAASLEDLYLVGGPEAGIRANRLLDRPLRYDVYLRPLAPRPGATLTPRERARYLSLPDSTTAELRELAALWTAGAQTDAARAQVVEKHLQTEYHYDLGSPSGGAANPLNHFLFESKRGHCEFYSTAMAVLLRTLGIPTRNVVGFAGGTYNRFGQYYAVRQSDAHSWVEVFLDGNGWTRFDPTPPSSVDAAAGTGVLSTLRDLIEAGLPWTWTPERVSRNLARRDTLVLTARDAERLAGFCIMQFDEECGHLSLFAVRPDCQRQGVGRRMLEWLTESALTAGIASVHLELRETNLAARRFYLQQGFAETVRIPGYYRGVETAVRMLRDIRVKA